MFFFVCVCVCVFFVCVVFFVVVALTTDDNNYVPCAIYAGDKYAAKRSQGERSGENDG